MTDFDKIKSLPIWKEKYEKLGVTPQELYMRQNGLCWLKQEVDSDGNVEIYCTDGKDSAITAKMLNPTIECIDCITRFTKKVISAKVDGKDKE